MKYYKLTLQIYHDDRVEDTDKRVQVQLAQSDETQRMIRISQKEADNIVINELINELKYKLIMS